MKTTFSQTSSLRNPALSAAVVLMLAACGGGSSEPAPEVPAGPQSIAIDFAAVAGTQPVQCGTPIAGLGTGAVTADLHDLRFYVSNVALLNDKDEAVPVTLEANDWQNGQLTLIDLENATGACADKGTAATNTQIRGTVPAGTYKGVKLTVGVPGSLNHTDYAAAAKPLDLQAMAWSWQAGRKFAQIEVNPAGGVARPAPAAPGTTFYVHLGSTGCTGNPVTGETVSCERPNRMDFHFHEFNTATQKIVVDVAALFKGTDLGTDLGSAPGCMSGSTDPECVAIFSVMKLDLATGKPIDDGHGQTLFRAEAK